MQMGQLRMLPLYHLGRIIAPWKDLPLRCIFRSAYKKIYVKKQVFSSSCIHSFLFICLKKKFHSWPYCFTCFFIVILYNLPFFIWVIIWLMFGSHNRLETTRKEIISVFTNHPWISSPNTVPDTQMHKWRNRRWKSQEFWASVFPSL